MHSYLVPVRAQPLIVVLLKYLVDLCDDLGLGILNSIVHITHVDQISLLQHLGQGATTVEEVVADGRTHHESRGVRTRLQRVPYIQNTILVIQQ